MPNSGMSTPRASPVDDSFFGLQPGAIVGALGCKKVCMGDILASPVDAPFFEPQPGTRALGCQPVAMTALRLSPVDAFFFGPQRFDPEARFEVPPPPPWY